MSDTKFTKGEWEVADGTKIGEQVLFIHIPEMESRGKVVCRLTRVVYTHIPLSEQDIANAHLIAAAPELYAMLEGLLCHFKSGDSDHFELNDAKIPELDNLLAKARGEK